MKFYKTVSEKEEIIKKFLDDNSISIAVIKTDDYNKFICVSNSDEIKQYSEPFDSHSIFEIFLDMYIIVEFEYTTSTANKILSDIINTEHYNIYYTRNDKLRYFNNSELKKSLARGRGVYALGSKGVKLNKDMLTLINNNLNITEIAYIINEDTVMIIEEK